MSQADEIDLINSELDERFGKQQADRARAMFGAFIFGPGGESDLDVAIRNNLDASSISAFFHLVVGTAQIMGEGGLQSSRALLRHAENHSLKQDVFTWLDANPPKPRGLDEAAEFVVKRVAPVKFRTARAWVGEWKKLRSAGTL